MKPIQKAAITAAASIACMVMTTGCDALHAAPISNAKANSNPAIETINWYSPEQRAKEARQQEQDADTVAPSRSDKAALVALAYARTKVGVPYLWGGTGTKAQGGRFDCSGLTKAAYAKAGIEIPRVANDQWNASSNHPPRADLKPGDLVFFGQKGNSRSIHHVGIYVGNGKMLHAPRTGTFIRTDDVSYMSDYFGATRVA